MIVFRLRLRVVTCRDVSLDVTRLHPLPPTADCDVAMTTQRPSTACFIFSFFLFPWPPADGCCSLWFSVLIIALHSLRFVYAYYTRTHWHFYCISLHFISIDSIYIYRTLYYWLLTEAVAHNYILRLKSILWYCAIVICLLIFVLIYVLVNICNKEAFPNYSGPIWLMDYLLLSLFLFLHIIILIYYCCCF